MPDVVHIVMYMEALIFIYYAARCKEPWGAAQEEGEA